MTKGKLVRYKIKDIKESYYNPRVMTEIEKGKLRTSIKEFGVVQNIIVNIRNNYVVGGNQRLQVLKELGYKEVDVVEVDLDDEKEKMLNLALNKVSGDWDYVKLEELFKEEFSADNLNLSGFDDFEIKALLNTDIEDDFDVEDIENKDSTVETKNNKISEVYLCEISFKKKEDAEEFLKGIGIENYEFTGLIKSINGDKL